MLRSRRLAAVLAALLLAALVLTQPGRVAAKSVLLLPDLFPTSPLRPLAWLTPEPWVETITFDYAGGQAEADIYHPGPGGRRGALIVELGAWKVPKTDPALVRFANGLARAGAVVLVPESADLRAGRVLPEERDALVQAFLRLQAMDDVDPRRVGFLGFSVGGGLVALAAEDARVRDRVGFVNTMGAYFDARALLEQIATRSIVVDGARVRWEPAEVTLLVFAIQLVEALEHPADREALAPLTRQEPLAADVAARLTPQGQAVLRLLRGVEPSELGEVLSALPVRTLDRLDAISPVRELSSLRAPLYVMHDVGDSFIPYVQSRYLVKVLAPPNLRLYTEFNIFQHVIPDKPVDVLTFALDLAKLYRHVVVVGQEFL